MHEKPDHISLDAVGIAALHFIQDPLEYETRTHHSNMDTYDHLSIEDLQQAAILLEPSCTIPPYVPKRCPANLYRSQKNLRFILIFRYEFRDTKHSFANHQQMFAVVEILKIEIK